MFNKSIYCFALFCAITGVLHAQDKSDLFALAEEAIEAKTFVIVPDSYTATSGAMENITDPYQFLLCENNVLYLQGAVTGAQTYTHRTEVASFTSKTDKRGITVKMQVKGTAIVARIEISVRKGSNYADVIVTPTRGEARSFSGPLVLPAQGTYIKRAGEV